MFIAMWLLVFAACCFILAAMLGQINAMLTDPDRDAPDIDGYWQRWNAERRNERAKVTTETGGA